MKTLILMALLAVTSDSQLPTQDQLPIGCPECATSAACSSACDECCDSLLGYGIIKPSDHCYDCFISPISNPFFFEDPRTLTEARFIYAHHKLPGTLGGGDLDVVALQLRAALTDRLSIVAAKDGFVFAGSDAPLDDGWNDVSMMAGTTSPLASNTT